MHIHLFTHLHLQTLSFQAVTYTNHSSTAVTLSPNNPVFEGTFSKYRDILGGPKGSKGHYCRLCVEERYTDKQFLDMLHGPHNKALATPLKLSRAVRKETLGSHRHHRHLHILQELDYGGLLGPEK